MPHYLSRFLLLEALLFSFFSIVCVYCDNFYVAPLGSDENQGTLENPWRSIEYSINQLKAGDTLFLREGVYSESIRIYEGGEENNRIIIRNYQDEKPLIEGSSVDAANGLVINTGHLELAGLEISNWECGIWAESSYDIQITNCTVHDVSYGIGFSDGTHNFTLRDCYLHHFDLYGFDASPSGGSDCYDGTIINCTAIHGRDPEQNVDGFALGHGDQHGFRFINCITIDVADGFDISADQTTLIGCWADRCYTAGYKIWGDEVTLMNCISSDGSVSNLELDWSGTPKTVSVINCDMINAATFNIWVENPKDTLILYNSIIAGGKNIGIAFESGLNDGYIGDYNLFQNGDKARMIVISYEQEFSLNDINSDNWSSKTSQDTHTIITENSNNLFQDAENKNFMPTETSPTIDKGGGEYQAPFDYDGLARPNGEGIDIGAYEYYDNRQNTRILPITEMPINSHSNTDNNQTEESSTGSLTFMIIIFAALVIITIIIIARRH